MAVQLKCCSAAFRARMPNSRRSSLSDKTSKISAELDRAEKLEGSARKSALSKLAATIGIPERTLARRKVSRRLTPNESERLLRISAIFEDAVDLFEGDVAAAVNWLSTPRKALGDRAPLAYARTEPGAREVENLIGRLEHGIFS